MTTKPLRGIYPILGTCFNEDESIDYASQEKLIEFCIANGVHGLVTLANASEGHLMMDEEKKKLAAFVVEKVNKRIPVVVTVNHPASYCAAEMGRYAESIGADAIMCMPPFFGRWRSGLGEIEAYFAAIDKAVNIPIIIQDHQLSDISLSVDFLVNLSARLNNLRYIKLEFGNIIHKARKILAHPQSRLEGVFGGNSGVFLPEEYEAGCCGTMPACYLPRQFSQAWSLLEAEQMQEAVAYFAPFARLAAYEKDVANRCLWKEILVKQGVIRSGKIRGPVPAFFEDWDKEQLLKVARQAGMALS
ncbi:MAG: dihydrodipicolinate synthase family protein [Adhaeribacter sp.]